MDIQPQAATTSQPISDDQELAKVLAGISQGNNNSLNFEELPAPAGNPVDEPAVSNIAQTPYTPPNLTSEPTVETPPAQPDPIVVDSTPNDLEVIKKDALIELRPLVDKLNLDADEKFDIYLLLLRSTDDKTLIAPAHEAAKDIMDEAKRAQALLDIIKEIDYLTSGQQTASI